MRMKANDSAIIMA